jgi:signal transduction histidine kinase
MALIILVSLAWVWVLRRRVRDQTAIIRQQVHREAALEERTRIAREFHDTLEQELVGITMQLDTIQPKLRTNPELAAQSLQVARQMVRRSLTEAHRSVWDLRCPALENGGLAAAFAEVARSMTTESGVRIELKTEGQRIAVPRVAETHLLRIGQEAITNAIKHSGAARIRLRW